MIPQHDRTWPVPRRRWLLRMKWHELLFMHWPVDATSIEPLIPAGLQVDTYDGSAWIGVVPFRMSGVAPRWLPDIPGLSAFPELNVRTYVTTEDDKPGVWFFSLDATNWLAVRAARRLFHLRYLDARINIERSGETIHYRSERTHRGEPAASLHVSYTPDGDPFFAEPGTLDFFLTARYCLYCQGKGRLYRGEIDHSPWPLRHASCQIESNTMVAGLGMELPKQSPLLHYCDQIDVVAWSNDCVINSES